MRRVLSVRTRLLICGALAGLVATSALAYGNSVSPNSVRGARFATSPPPLDHFKCYLGKELTATKPQAVLLRDQFATGAKKVVVKSFYRYCNPVKKLIGDKLTPVRYPDLHLTFYWITNAPAGGHRIQFSNQFGRQKVVVGPAKWLAVPTSEKSALLPSPKLLNHFECYPVRKGTPLGMKATLIDQWHTERSVEVQEPLMFCNPAEKVHAKKKYPIVNAAAHLVCYRLGGVGPFEQRAMILNQFNKTALTVTGADRLCVPSRKLKAVPLSRST